MVGVELDNEAGRQRVETVNDGRLPITSSDPRMEAALTEAVSAGNLRATTDPEAYESAEVAIAQIESVLQERACRQARSSWRMPTSG